MLKDFKLIIDADILAFWASFPENWAKFYSIFWSHCQSLAT